MPGIIAQVAAEAVQVLKLAGVSAWTLAYLLIIRRNAKDQSIGMPLAALAGNLSIEFAFALPLAATAPRHYPLVYGIWLLLDLVILMQAFRYGPAVYRDVVEERWFPLVLVGAVGVALSAVFAVAYEFQDWSSQYSAFAGNAVMSILFVAMVRRRSDVGGQSIYIGWAKLIGTVSFTLLVAVSGNPSRLVIYLGVVSFLFDAFYVVLLRQKLRTLGISPWRRV
jgi:hypothetical protein